MRYYVTVQARTFQVDLSGEEIRIDGAAVRADLASIAGTRLRHLLASGASVPIIAARGEAKGTWELHVDGRRLELEVVDERTRSIRQLTGTAARPQGPRPIRAPMPGLVVRVEVAPGDAVQAGQGLIIVEAMKMQNELKAEAGARVARVLVEPGQAVEKGALLIEFESDAA